ncbi:hypothetical protein ES332_D03G201400v1 [Gossypium tomentosum]|uniref:Uncharacterized protein n=1 Tax=Gossypium tomentosum TaxID=34277 RepID=A0A5D2LQC8_GOSTO|nr:hypothetical protein ES332_D03G201400v1 [Gossypium tomentosum]
MLCLSSNQNVGMQIFSVPPAGPAQLLQEDIQGLALPRMVYMDFVCISYTNKLQFYSKFIIVEFVG